MLNFENQVQKWFLKFYVYLVLGTKLFLLVDSHEFLFPRIKDEKLNPWNVPETKSNKYVTLKLDKKCTTLEFYHFLNEKNEWSEHKVKYIMEVIVWNEKCFRC